VRAGGLSRRAWLASAAALAACRPRPHVSPGACPSGNVDLLVRGGPISTGDPASPVTTALAAADGVVVALGAEAEARAKACPPGQVVELAGGSAVAGLVDAHAHLAGLATALAQVDLRGARSIEEVVARCRPTTR
jgi:predicted amidohydrolase YtcJ